MNPSRIIRIFSTLAVLMGAANLASAQMTASVSFPAPQIAPAMKKGLGVVTNRPGWNAKLEAIKAAWFYSWGADIPSGIPAGVVFVPMVWGWRDGSLQTSFIQNLAAERAAGKFDTLLGFNEPDGKDQSNLPVAAALAAWPQLESVGARLGSPAGIHPDSAWMTDFMRGAKTAHLRVDFITVHWYGSANQAADFISYLARIHSLYNKPIWITEFCPADWQAGPGHPNSNTPQMVVKFMRAVIPALKRTPYIERYAWFSADADSVKLGTGALFKPDGSLTELGKIYAAY